MTTFTHLEVHSHFTLLGAAPSVPELVARARRDGMAHLALTDTNALYGAVAFARACREAGVRREKRREVRDSLSAVLILQGYLDLRNRG